MQWRSGGNQTHTPLYLVSALTKALVYLYLNVGVKRCRSRCWYLLQMTTACINLLMMFKGQSLYYFAYVGDWKIHKFKWKWHRRHFLPFFFYPSSQTHCDQRPRLFSKSDSKVSPQEVWLSTAAARPEQLLQTLPLHVRRVPFQVDVGMSVAPSGDVKSRKVLLLC